MPVATVRPDTTPVAFPAPAAPAPAVEVEGLHRRFGGVEALRGIGLEVAPCEVHGLLGHNGAGKTTLLRVLSGIVDPTAGSAQVLGRRAGRSRDLRALIGTVPAGDRSFYLRLSGLENLLFFGRLHGLPRRAARERAVELLRAVGLDDAARRPVNTYSHGMQKRLSFARALIGRPALLLVDEATHDLDPVAAHRVRALAAARARDGAAVLWATQRLEELHGFADRVTVLDHGAVAFSGTVPALTALGSGSRHVLELGPATHAPPAALDAALGEHGRLEPAGDAHHVLLTLRAGVTLGVALGALLAAGAEVLACRDELPPIERAYLSVTGERAA
jgi:ABC-type multidrug transport system ATPase subunit